MHEANLIKIVGKVAQYRINKKQVGHFSIECQSEKSKNKNFIPMISPRNPTKEAERLIGNFKLKDGFLVFLFGAASIYLLKNLLKQQACEGGNIFLIEVDFFLLEELVQLGQIPIDRVFIVSLKNQHHLIRLIENIEIEKLLGYRIFKNSISIQLEQSFYSQVENTIKKQLASRFSDLFTRLEFESRWIINSFSQVPFFSKSYPINILFNKGKKMKAILVSSGPSLRESLPYLKQNASKFFIACVDSIYRVLHDYGILPHLIITLDCQAYTLRHFLGLYKGKKNEYPMLYADLVANPQVTRGWKGDLFFGVTAQYMGDTRKVTLGSDYIEEEMRKQNTNFIGFGDIQSGGSVATSLFDLLRQMSFDEIILVGQDLAYTNREIHCTGTHHTVNWLSKNIQRLESIENINHTIIKKRSTNYQKSIQGKPIITDYVLSLYQSWFEDAANRKLDVKIFNATHEGIPIKRIPCLALTKTKAPKIQPPQNSSSWFEGERTISQDSLIAKLGEDILDERFSSNTRKKYEFMKSVGRKYKIQNRRKTKGNITTSTILEETNLKKLEDEKNVWSKIQRVFLLHKQPANSEELND